MAGHIPKKDILAEIRRRYSEIMMEKIDREIMSEVYGDEQENDNENEHKEDWRITLKDGPMS